MFCEKCGNQVADDARCCAHCGSPTGAALAPAPPPAAGSTKGNKGTLKVTVNTGSGVVQYCEDTTASTLDAVRKGILEGKLPSGASASFETLSGGKVTATKEGTLLKCAWPYPQLANLYEPVRSHARYGRGYGILAGIVIHLGFLGFALLGAGGQAADYGTRVLAIPACILVLVLLARFKVPQGLLFIPAVAPGILIFSLSYNPAVFGGFFGAAISGGILWSMPGMAIGAVVGVIRRRGLPRAVDAPHEKVTLLIAIPLVIAAALLTAYILWAKSYLSPAS